MNPGPRTARSASPIAPGTVLEDGTKVGQYLGRSAGALNFYGESEAAGRVVVKLLAPALDPVFERMRPELEALRAIQHPALQRVVQIGRYGPRNTLTYAYLDGRTMRAAIARRMAAKGAFDLDAVYNVLGHASSAIELLHTVTAHGVLTHENVFVLRNGSIVVGNVGYAQVMLRSFGPDSEVFANSAFLAPEVRDDPWAANEASDIYSLGVLALSMLTGVEPTRANLPELVEHVDRRWKSGLGGVLKQCLANEPLMRFSTLAAMRQAVQEVRTLHAAAQTQPNAPSGTGDLSDALAQLVMSGSSGPVEAKRERWLLRTDHGDVGPYSARTIQTMLEGDQIDEYAVVVDLDDDSVASLVDTPEFTDFVMDYLPRRQKRRMAQEERREEIKKTVKRGSLTSVVAGTIAVVAGAAILAQLRTATPQLPLADAIEPFRARFVVGEVAFTEIAADQDLVAALFDVSEPVPEPDPEPARNAERRGSPNAPAYVAPSLEDYVLAFDSSQPPRKLTSAEINQTLNANVARLQRCFRNELAANPGFTGVTVQCAIVPDGRTAEIEVRTSGPLTATGRQCVERAFQRMRFPAFNDVPMRVSFPFTTQ